MKPHIVGIAGKRGAGKSVASGYLMSQFGFTNVKFAGPLKDMMRAVGLTEEEVEGYLKEQPCELLMGRTPRHAMQTLGTEWGRNMIHEHFWTNLWVQRAMQHRLVVADDCRFPNEFQAIRSNGGKIIWIDRPNNPFDQSGAAAQHASETSADAEKFDHYILNDGSPMDLGRKVYELVF